MYFLTALVCSIIAIILLIIFKDKKRLHFDILAIVFGAATIMWLMDCIFSAVNGEGFLSFETQDIWISLWTVLGGVVFWGIITLIINHSKKTKE